jgi:hypothetical protein
VRVPEHKIKNKTPSFARNVKWGTQLMLIVEAVMANGQVVDMQCLVDTGAECNLIRKGFVPHHLTRAAKDKISLVAVNGHILEGGSRITTLQLSFEKEVEGHLVEGKAKFKADFYEAVIDVDAILSYTWLAKEKLGVVPHHRALAQDEPVCTLLYGRGGGLERQGVEGERRK